MASRFPNDQSTKVWKPKDFVEGEGDKVGSEEVVAQVNGRRRYQGGDVEERVRVRMV
jgi:hypothetical protein